MIPEKLTVCPHGMLTSTDGRFTIDVLAHSAGDDIDAEALCRRLALIYNKHDEMIEQLKAAQVSLTRAGETISLLSKALRQEHT